MAFAEADLLPADADPFDVIVANLPYVRSDAMAALPRATTFEPALALDGGADGLALIGRLVDLLPAALQGDGVALLEIGADQGEAIVALVAARLPGWTCTVEPDLAGLPRVARVAKG
jgi:release factor glutamine methyltransferase